MCTAITYRSGDFYFGRNLDLGIDYGEEVTVMPRGFTFPMKCEKDLVGHYAMTGMAVTAESCPLFFEATNERGLSMAGLNFPDNAVYCQAEAGRLNLAPYELIPWLLGKCAALPEAREELRRLNIIDAAFSEDYPLSPLHWIIADSSGALTVESTKDGLKIYENPYGVLSNNPPFDRQMINAERGAFPADSFSSESRFIRAARLTETAAPKKDEAGSVSQFFRMLAMVSVPEGCVTKEGRPHFTRYACCCNTDKGIFYYNRCDDYRVRAVKMRECDLDGGELQVIKST